MSIKSRADRYRENVDRHVEGGSRGTIVMATIFVLSAILSAVFFWRHSQGVFAGTPWIFATVLGLLVGLVPSEGAFFGWKDIQKKRASELTGAQISAASWGMWLGITFAVMNITGLFLTSFPGVPDAMMQVAPWIAFLALALPIPVQLILFARYSTNEQSVIEARQQAQLNAAKHSAAIKAEKARIGATLEGMDDELEQLLDGYGHETGRENAQTALGSGDRNIMDRFYARFNRGQASPPEAGSLPQLPASLSDDDVRRIAAALSAMGNSTHDTPRHADVVPVVSPNGREQGGTSARP